ncbi:NADH-quinone oxidoreductase subunit J family protein [Raineya sp.]|jgi:NADH:ubiquinone oxidoreductase subunit 6 (subunit J)
MQFFAIFLLLLALGLIIFTRNMVYAVFSLLLLMLCLVVLYLYLGADFVATAQLMIYVGGVLVLLIMGVMLAPRNKEKTRIPVNYRRNFVAAMIALALGGILMKETLFLKFADVENPLQATTEKIGISFLTEYLIAFEVAGILLLVALVGASSIAGKKKHS